MTKTDKLRALLRKQWVTPLDALNHCGLLSLSQRITQDIEPELRAQASWEYAQFGMLYNFERIERRWVKLPSGARVMSYRIVR